MSKIDNIFKKTNIANIQNLKEDNFLEAFLVGHEFYEDYIYLKKNIPDMVDSLDLNGTWKDYQGDTKVFNKNQEYFLGRTVKDSVFLLGEAKFLEDGTVDWLRYSEDYKFSMGDYLFCRNGKGYKGTLPEEERPHAESLGSYYLFYENVNGDKIEYDISRYSPSLTLKFNKNNSKNKYTLKVRISLLEDDYEFYLFDEKNDRIEKINKNNFLEETYKSIRDYFFKNTRKVDACINSFEHININYDSIIYHLTK